MSPLEERIDQDLVAALKSGDTATRDTLRMVKTALHNQAIEKRGDLTDDETLAVLRKEAKSRQESIDQFTQGGRTEAAATEKAEKTIIEKYLPSQLSDDELKQLVDEAIKTTGAASPAEMGKVIKEVLAKGQGRVDGARASAAVKAKLG